MKLFYNIRNCACHVSRPRYCVASVSGLFQGICFVHSLNKKVDTQVEGAIRNDTDNKIEKAYLIG